MGSDFKSIFTAEYQTIDAFSSLIQVTPYI
jgi:hypothetical protein